MTTGTRASAARRGLGGRRATAGIWAIVALNTGAAVAAPLEARIHLGAQTDLADAPEARFEARLEYETQRYRDIKAVFDVGVDSDSRRVEIKDAFADLKRDSSDWRFRFGRGKKVVGWEYEDSERDRLALERSLAYQFMETTAMVGRDYFLGVRWNDLGSSFHYDDAGTVAAVLSWIPQLGADVIWGNWLLVQKHRLYGVDGLFWSAASGLKGASGRHRWAVELFAGRDPFQTEQELVFGDGSGVHFAAGKLEYGVTFGEWTPYAQAAALLPDLRDLNSDSVRALVGLRYGFLERFYLAGELEAFGYDSASSIDGRMWNSPMYRTQLTVFLP